VTRGSRAGTGRTGPSPACGASLVELLAVVAIVASMLGIGLPLVTHTVDAKRTLDAAAFLAGQFRLARQRAVLTGRHTAIVFDDVGGRVGWRVCRDGDRDGVSRADITAGVDGCDGPPRPIADQFSSVQVGYAPGVPGLDGEASAAPVRFGVARMAVFTPLGTASSGSIVLRGAGLAQSAVRVAGATGRTRIVRFDSGRWSWVE
jgi:type II secretory pathway pseudopilin PulG